MDRVRGKTTKTRVKELGSGVIQHQNPSSSPSHVSASVTWHCPPFDSVQQPCAGHASIHSSFHLRLLLFLVNFPLIHSICPNPSKPSDPLYHLSFLNFSYSREILKMDGLDALQNKLKNYYQNIEKDTKKHQETRTKPE